MGKVRKRLSPTTSIPPDHSLTLNPTTAFFFSPPKDHILRGQELPGALPRVQQRQRRPPLLLQQVQLHPGGERLLHGLREAQLHGQPVLPAEGRVRRQPARDWHERLRPILPDDPSGTAGGHLLEFLLWRKITPRQAVALFVLLLINGGVTQQ